MLASFSIEDMYQLRTIMMVLTIVVSAGIIVHLVESVDAWHSQFATKKECTNFMKGVVGNTTAEANAMCQKIVPH
jgi:hypothetical protein